MKREEAIGLLKEIVAACEVDLKHISLKESSGKTNAESEGFELHIKNHFDEKDWERLRNILQEHDLSMKKYDDSLVIYKPRQPI